MLSVRQCCEQMEKLEAIDAPAALKAHLFVNLLVPAMYRAIGVTECASEMQRRFATDMALASGLCTICLKVEAMNADAVCVKCQADLDQLFAAIDD